MGRRSRAKGQRNEQAIVNLLKDAGLAALRVPLSGAQAGFGGDVLIDGERYEAKIRADGFREIYKWIDGNAGLFLRADRQEPLIVVRVSDWIKLRRRHDEL
jgi:hypothetical protein